MKREELILALVVGDVVRMQFMLDMAGSQQTIYSKLQHVLDCPNCRSSLHENVCLLWPMAQKALNAPPENVIYLMDKTSNER